MKIQTQTFAHLTLACLIGLLFVLPNGVRIWRLGSFRDYSPFSVRTASTTVWDETFMYGAEVNYSYQRHRLAYDTDAYEHRNEPVPYSILPVEAEVLLAELFGGVAIAQIICHFLFPALTSWLLISLFLRLRCSTWLAALLALSVLIISFSPLTFYHGITDLLTYGARSHFVDTLQAARNPHPNMSFPAFLGALMLLCSALHRGSWRRALAAGVLGGLLFYIYIYYAIAWSAGITLLAITVAGITLTGTSDYPFRIALIPLGTTVLLGLPFLWWLNASKEAGGYTYRSGRLGMIYSHLPSRHDVVLSALFLAAIAIVAVCWALLRQRALGITPEMRRFTDLTVLVFSCAGLGGIAGINLQLLTGFNVQAEKHYTHMVVQPALIVMMAVVFLAVSARFRKNMRPGWSAALFLVLYGMGAAVQVSAAVNSAQAHRIRPSDRELFHWLERNTTPDDVVATTNLQLSASLPVFTHDYTLMANGTRTSGDDEEVLDRFLLANALVNTPPDALERELMPTGPQAIYRAGDPILSNYAPFLYEHSPYRDPNPFKPAFSPIATAAVLARYSHLNLSQQLRRFRVNYIYAMNGQSPAEISGWRVREVFHTGQGALWNLAPADN